MLNQKLQATLEQDAIITPHLHLLTGDHYGMYKRAAGEVAKRAHSKEAIALWAECDTPPTYIQVNALDQYGIYYSWMMQRGNEKLMRDRSGRSSQKDEDSRGEK